MGISGEGRSGDDAAGLLARERQSLDILSVKKEAKQSVSDVPGLGVDDGKLQLCRSPKIPGCFPKPFLLL